MKISILLLVGIATNVLSIALPTAEQVKLDIAPYSVKERISKGAIINSVNNKNSEIEFANAPVHVNRDVEDKKSQVKADANDKDEKFIIAEKNIFSHDCANHLAGIKLHPKGVNAVCDIKAASELSASELDSVSASVEGHVSLASADAEDLNFSAFTCTTTPHSPSCYNVIAAGLYLRQVGGRVVQRNEGFTCDLAMDKFGVKIHLCSAKGDWLHSATIATIVGWFKDVCLRYDTRCEGYVTLNRKGSRIIAGKA